MGSAPQKTKQQMQNAYKLHPWVFLMYSISSSKLYQRYKGEISVLFISFLSYYMVYANITVQVRSHILPSGQVININTFYSYLLFTPVTFNLHACSIHYVGWM